MLGKRISVQSLDESEELDNLKRMRMVHPVNTMLNGYEDVWKLIFSFCQTNDLSPLLLVCEHLRSVVLTVDSFLFEKFIDFLMEATNEIYPLPSLDYFLAHSMPQTFRNIQHKKLWVRFSHNVEDEPYLLHVIRTTDIKINEIPERNVRVFPHLKELRQDFANIFKLIKELKDDGVILETVKKLQELLNRCHGYTYNSKRAIPKLCYRLLSGFGDGDEGIEEDGESDEDDSDEDDVGGLYDDLEEHNDNLNVPHESSTANELLWVKEFIREAIRYDYRVIDKCPETVLSNHDLVLAVIEQAGYVLCSPRLKLYRNDKTAMLLVLKKTPEPFKYASEDLKRDREVVLAALKVWEDYFLIIPVELRSDREFVLSAVQVAPYTLRLISDRFKNDKQIVLAAVSTTPHMLGYASIELKNDKDVVLAAVKVDGTCIEFASERLKANKEVALTAVANKPEAIRFLSAELKGDLQVILTGLTRDGETLEYAPDTLKNDKEVLKLILKKCPRYLEHVSQELKNDPEVVQIAVSSNPWAIVHALGKYLADLNIMSIVVQKEPRLVHRASQELRNNKEFMMSVVRKKGHLLRCASDELKNDEDVVLAAIKASDDGMVLSEASIEMKGNIHVVQQAILKNATAMQYASTELRNNKELALLVVRQDPLCLLLLSDELQQDRQVILAAIEHDRAIEKAASYIPDYLMNDREFVMLAVGRNGLALFHANKFEDDPEIVLSAIENTARALMFASENLKKDKAFLLKVVMKNKNAIDYIAGDIRSSSEFQSLLEVA